jgi:hypothetical protein
VPNGKAELSLGQNFQAIEGEMTLGAESITLSKPTLRGVDIRFDVQATKAPLRFAGRIDGNRISGTVRSGEREWPWHATRVE